MVDLLIGYLMDFARWLIVLILAFIYPDTYSAWNAKVVEIVRADEIKVERDGLVQTIRLYGIDSPIWWGPSTRETDEKKGTLPGSPNVKERTHVERRLAPQNFGDAAKRYMEQRVLAKAVRVQPLPSRVKGPWYRPGLVLNDRYDRIIGLVYVYGEGGRSLNEELLERGLAWWYRPFVPFERGYKHLQDIAKEQGAGIWSLPDPAPPWEWQGTRIDKLNPLQRGESEPLPQP